MPNCASDAGVPPEAGARLSGFLCTRVTALDELRCVAYEAIHEATGARLLHLHAADAENLFAVAFRTPPRDDTGVAHILEHSVLGGSKKFPVKEPFVEMLKSSMATFINAMTYPDRTVYPVASNVKPDFFNLVDVYCDAVFHPNITPMTLKQEGHHLEFAEPGNIDSALTIHGIVYNEMKGAYSDPDAVIDRESERKLFPDTPYGFDSGGDPDAIPNLQYEAFVRFYRRLYHPGNARIFVYGDIPTAAHCAFLNERLGTGVVSERPADTRIPFQPRWTAPREQEQTYPIGAGEETRAKTAITLNWLIGAVADPVTDLALEVVDKLLLGSAAAPLRKALVDSQLGEDLTAAGYSSGTLEGSFHVGLKGSEPERKQAFLDLVFKTLRDLVGNGVSPARVDIAFNQLEYAHREIQSMYPLLLMDRVYGAWNFDLDPLTYLCIGKHLDDLRAAYAADRGLFGRLIQEKLIDNPHRLTAVFRPDPELLARRAETFAGEMRRRHAALTPEQRRRIDAEAAELKAMQDTPNSPEALQTLPQLALTDVPAEPKAIPTQVIRLRDAVPLVRADVYANGVNYLVLAFDLNGLPDGLWEYVPLLTGVLSRMGTGRHSYVQMAERIAGNTGGVRAATFAGTEALRPERVLRYLTVSLKAVDRTYRQALDIVRELLLELDLADHDRLRDVLIQRKVRLQSAIVPHGHHFAALHAGRHISDVACLSELWGGLPQVRLADRLATNFTDEVDDLCERVERVRRFVLERASLCASFTGTDSLEAATRDWIEGLGARAGTRADQAASGPQAAAPRDGAGSRCEGLAMAADVAYCARCLPAPHVSDPQAPLLQVFSRLLGYGYLWDEVRVKGGAYGGMSVYDAGAGVLELLSYRDPGIERTLRVYDQILAHVRRAEWSPRDIERAVIGCAKDDERPIRPGAAVGTALWRHLGGVSEELRRERRDALLHASPEAVKKAALALLESNLAQSRTCVLSSRQKLEAANRVLPTPLRVEEVLPGGNARPVSERGAAGA